MSKTTTTNGGSADRTNSPGDILDFDEKLIFNFKIYENFKKTLYYWPNKENSFFEKCEQILFFDKIIE